MRLLSRLLLLILLGGVLTYFAPSLNNAARMQRDNNAQKLDLAKNATSSIVYELNANQFLCIIVALHARSVIQRGCKISKHTS